MKTSSSSTAVNTAGSADLSFGNATPKNGTVIYRNTVGISRALSNGSTLTAGLFTYQNNHFIGLTKHTPTGEEDINFGFWLTPAEDRDVLVDMLIQPDNKPLLLAANTDGEAAFVTRFRVDNGDVDKSFGTNGQVVLNQAINLGETSKAGLAVQGDGNIIVVFNDGTKSFVYQLDESGRFINFGNNGPLEVHGVLLSAVLTTAQGFVLAGTSNGKAHLSGYTNKGELNTGFGNNGLVHLPLSGNHDEQVTVLASGPEGRIAVVGGIAVVGDSHKLPHQMNFVASLLANGQLDMSFNAGQPLETETNHGNYASVTVQNDGKIVALARNDSGNLVKLLRHTVTGQLDADFGDQGVAIAWNDTQSRPQPSCIDKLERVLEEERLQSSGTLGGNASFIGRLLSR